MGMRMKHSPIYRLTGILCTTLRCRELLLAQVEPWAGGGRMLDERVGL